MPNLSVGLPQSCFGLKTQLAYESARTTPLAFERRPGTDDDIDSLIWLTDLSAFVLIASANIAAGGAATTFQLNAPSGKATSDFAGGRIQDDENPGDMVAIGTAQYREDEWSIEPTANSVNGTTYEFRVVPGSNVPFGTYTVTPQWTVTPGIAVTPAKVSLTLTTYVPTVAVAPVGGGVTVTPGKLALVLTAFAPTVATPRLVTPAKLSLTLTEFAPTVATPRLVTPPKLSLTLTEFAPTVAATANQFVVPAKLALILTELTPTVRVGVNVVPAKLGLVLTEFAPTVVATANQSVVPAKLALLLSEFAPTITVAPVGSGTVTPRTLTLLGVG